MNMFRLETDYRALVRWAHAVRISSDDTGYLLHAALRTAFGHLAPQPFCIQGEEVLGYADADEESLRAALKKRVESGELPDTALRLPEICCKALPQRWTEGARLYFRVLASPIRRFHIRDENGERRGEKDVYLLDVEKAARQQTPPLGRAESYMAWLREQLARDGAAEAEEVRLTGHRLVRPVRRGGKGHEGPARALGGRPEAHFEGVLRVRQEAAFAGLVKRGIGRHRAFGYGMLLLRSA